MVLQKVVTVSRLSHLTIGPKILRLFFKPTIAVCIYRNNPKLIAHSSWFVRVS